MAESLKGLRQDLIDAKEWYNSKVNPLNTLEGRAMYSYMFQLKEKINEVEQSFGTLCINGSYEDHLKDLKNFNINE